MNDCGRVQAIDRAVSILKCFSKHKKELKLSEIADATGLNKSTVHGIISTLKFHGLINQDEKTQKYRLGLNLIELGELVLYSMDINDIINSVVCDVCKELEETVHVGVLNLPDIIYIYKSECNKSIKISTNIGSKQPAYCTADGRTILAYMNTKNIIKIIPEKIEKHTEYTKDRDQIIEELAIIKKRGYAVDYQENIKGIICVAAPIFDYSGNVKYGISVMGPTISMTDKKINDTIIVIKDAAAKISKKIGYKG